MTSFTPPAGASPVMLTFAGDGIWYTENGQDTLGFLDPFAASGQTTTLVPGSLRTVTPTCQVVTPGQFTTTAGTGTLSWAANNWSTVASGGGWTVYQMPPGADPYGVAALPGYVWTSDLGRHRVARFPYTSPATRTPTVTPTATATPTATTTATSTATPAARVFLPLIIK